LKTVGSRNVGKFLKLSSHAAHARNDLRCVHFIAPFSAHRPPHLWEKRS
jgi:hypothetical protein